MSGESRTELLAWLNETLDLQYAKVEQCGTGAAYCQIVDSVYGDLPMSKVKFNAQQEYQYLANFKVLQLAFLKHRIDKTVVVERLVKCRFQDNLEFLQWMKKWWMENKDTSEYDASARRVLGAGAARPAAGGRVPARSAATATTAASTPAARRAVMGGSRTPSGSGPSLATGAATRRLVSSGTSTSRLASRQQVERPGDSGSALPRTRPASVSVPPAVVAQNEKLQAELEELRTRMQLMTEELEEYHRTADGLETERNFYFNKLRDIEVLYQNASDPNVEPPSAEGLLGLIQEILYSTEEGFQIPDAPEEDVGGDDEDMF